MAFPRPQQDRPLDQTGGTDRGRCDAAAGVEWLPLLTPFLMPAMVPADPADHTVDRGATDRPRRGDDRLR